MRARMSKSSQNRRCRNDFSIRTLQPNGLSTENLDAFIARALEDSSDNQFARLNIPVPGGHAGRSRAHAERIRCANPYQMIPCGRHARAHVEFIPKSLFS